MVVRAVYSACDSERGGRYIHAIGMKLYVRCAFIHRNETRNDIEYAKTKCKVVKKALLPTTHLERRSLEKGCLIFEPVEHSAQGLYPADSHRHGHAGLTDSGGGRLQEGEGGGFVTFGDESGAEPEDATYRGRGRARRGGVRVESRIKYLCFGRSKERIELRAMEKCVAEGGRDPRTAQEWRATAHVPPDRLGQQGEGRPRGPEGGQIPWVRVVEGLLTGRCIGSSAEYRYGERGRRAVNMRTCHVRCKTK